MSGKARLSMGGGTPGRGRGTRSKTPTRGGTPGRPRSRSRSKPATPGSQQRRGRRQSLAGLGLDSQQRATLKRFQDWDQLQEIEEELIEKFTNAGLLDGEVTRVFSTLNEGQANLEKRLDGIIKCLTGWQTREGNSACGFWTLLKDYDVSYKRLLVAFYAMIKQNKGIQISFKAAGVYMQMVGIPGQFEMLNDLVFRQACRRMTEWAKAHSLVETRRRRREAQKSKGRAGSQASQGDDDDCPFEAGEEQVARGNWCSSRDANKYIKHMIRQMEYTCSKIDLNNADLFALVVEVCTELARISIQKHSPLEFVPNSAYKTLTYLMHPRHGDLTKNFLVVCQSIIGNILCEFEGTQRSPAPTVPLKRMRNKGLTWVRQTMSNQMHDLSQGCRILLQQLCYRAPERKQYHLLAVETVMDLVEDFPLQIPDMVTFLERLSHNAKISARHMAVALGRRILSLAAQRSAPPEPAEPGEAMEVDAAGEAGEAGEAQPEEPAPAAADGDDAEMKQAEEKQAEGGNDEDEKRAEVQDTGTISKAENQAVSILLNMLCERSNDQAAKVRAGALTSLAAVTQEDRGFVKKLRDIFPSAGRSHSDDIDPAQQQLQTILNWFDQKAKDPKPYVRLASIEAATAMLMNEPCENIYRPQLKILMDGCRDKSLKIRKSSMKCLSKMWQKHPCWLPIQKAWMEAALPLTNDREQGAVEKCIDWIIELILDPLCDSIRRHDEDRSEGSIWYLLGECYGDTTRYFQKGVGILTRKLGVLKEKCPKLIPSIKRIVRYTDEKGAWLLIDEISSNQSQAIASKDVFACWEKHLNKADGGPARRRDSITSTANRKKASHRLHVLVLNTLGNVAADENMNFDQALDVAKKLYERLSDFKSSPDQISAMLNALNAICFSLLEKCPDRRQEVVELDWKKNLVRDCHIALEGVLVKNPNIAFVMSDDVVSAYLFTLGEVMLLTQTKAPKMTIQLIQAFTPTHLVFVDTTTTKKKNQKKLAVAVRSHAYLALGKFCLIDQDLAYKMITIFVRELRSSPSPVLRNNMLVIMCDLASAYASLVDHYVVCLTAVTRDEHVMVRKHAYMILTQLIQEDYLKWKGSLFYRFITGLCDRAREVKEFVTNAIQSMVEQKFPTLFPENFVQLVFYLNGFTASGVDYNHWPDDQDERKFAINEEGVKLLNEEDSSRRPSFVREQAEATSRYYRGKRFFIYNFLLNKMTDEQRFTTGTTLAMKVLKAVSDGRIPINAQSFPMLKDTFIILAGKSIKLRSIRNRFGGGDGDDNAGVQVDQDHQLEAAKGKILSVLVKKNAMENIMPMMIELKRLLEHLKSGLQKYHYMYLESLLTDYKNQIQEICAGDKQLAAELEYDIKRFAEARERAKARRKVRRMSLASNVGPKTPRRSRRGSRRFSVDSTYGPAGASTPRLLGRDVSHLQPGGMDTPAMGGSPVGKVRLRRRSSNHGVASPTTQDLLEKSRRPSAAVAGGVKLRRQSSLSLSAAAKEATPPAAAAKSRRASGVAGASSTIQMSLKKPAREKKWNIEEPQGISEVHVGNRIRIKRGPHEGKSGIIKKILQSGKAGCVMDGGEKLQFSRRMFEIIANTPADIAAAAEAVSRKRRRSRISLGGEGAKSAAYRTGGATSRRASMGGSRKRKAPDSSEAKPGA